MPIEIATMISSQMLKQKTAMHDNVDDKIIIPALEVVQDMYVQPLLGSTLYKKILADIKTNSLSGKYKELLDEYLLNVICQYALAEIAPDLNAQYYNKGVTNKQADGSTAVVGSDLKTVIARHISKGEWYAERCKRYLQQYANQYYPEYYQLTPGIDTIVPTTQVWNCPISLSTDVSNVKPHAYYND